MLLEACSMPFHIKLQKYNQPTSVPHALIPSFTTEHTLQPNTVLTKHIGLSVIVMGIFEHSDTTLVVVAHYVDVR